jgi:hypothetical protein
MIGENGATLGKPGQSFLSKSAPLSDHHHDVALSVDQINNPSEQ